MQENKQGLCSVCCLGYKHVAYLEQCIKSIWDQEYKNIEIIVLDDGSNDGSIELLTTLQENSPCAMKIITQENSGNISANLNKTWKQTSGEFISLIALDDALYPDAISNHLSFMNADKHIALSANSQITGIYEKGERSDAIEKLPLFDMENPSIDDLLDLEFSSFGAFYIQGSIFRKDILIAVDGFDEDMLGDDIVLRTRIFRYLQKNPQYTIKITKNPACYYRMHETNSHKNFMRQIKSITSYLDTYWPDRENPKKLVTWFYHALKKHPSISLADLIALPRLAQYKNTIRTFRILITRNIKLLFRKQK